MFKSNEYKAYGSIRKTKVAGTCGVILAKKEETVKPVESADLDSTVKKAKEAGIKVTEKEKVGYDTEDQAKADEKAQVAEIDKKIAEKK